MYYHYCNKLLTLACFVLAKRLPVPFQQVPERYQRLFLNGSQTKKNCKKPSKNAKISSVVEPLAARSRIVYFNTYLQSLGSVVWESEFNPEEIEHDQLPGPHKRYMESSHCQECKQGMGRCWRLDKFDLCHITNLVCSFCFGTCTVFLCLLSEFSFSWRFFSWL